MNSEKVEFHETISQQWEGIQLQNNSKITLRFLKEILCSAVPISKEELSGLITAVIKFFTGQVLSLYENSHKTTAEKAIQFLEQLVHTNYNALGTFSRNSQKTSQALIEFTKGVLFAEKLKKTFLVHCYLNLNLSGVLAECKRYAEAIDYSRKAITYSQELLLAMKEDSPDRLQIFEAVCISYHSLGVQVERVGNIESAIEWHEKALKFAVRHLGESRKDLIDSLYTVLTSLTQKTSKSRPSAVKDQSFASNNDNIPDIQKGVSVSKLRPTTAKYRLKSQPRAAASESKRIGLFKMPFHSSHIPKVAVAKQRKKENVPKSATRKVVSTVRIEEEARSSAAFDPTEHEAILDSLKIEPIKPIILVRTETPIIKAEVLEEKSPNDLITLVPEIPSKAVSSSIAIQTDLLIENIRGNTPSPLENPSDPKFKRTSSVREAKLYESAPSDFFDLKYNTKSKASSIPESRSQALHKALVESYRIDLLQKEYEIKYFINSALDTLYIIASNDFEKYELDYAIDSETSILDIIHEKIHPHIDLINEELELVDTSVSMIFEGSYFKDNTHFSVRIDHTAPRSNIIVTFQNGIEVFSKKFSFLEIVSYSLQPNMDKNILFSCFYIENNEIKIQIPQGKSLKLIYFKPYVLDNISYNIKISAAVYSNSSAYLIEAISNNSASIKPLLIDSKELSRKLTVEVEAIQDKIAGVACLLSIDDSQVCFTKQMENDTPKGLDNKSFFSQKPKPKEEGAEEISLRYNTLDS